MQLDRTHDLIRNGVDLKNPLVGLGYVLEAAIELVALPGNDFDWSHWRNAAQAQAEINELLEHVRSGQMPDRLKVAVLFGPTGPLQEVTSEAQAFLKVAAMYDQIENALWPQQNAVKPWWRFW